MMVLGKTDGILHRITATLSPVGNTLSIPYDLVVRFSYDEKENPILPSDLTYITYYTNSDRVITRKKSSRIRFNDVHPGLAR